MPKHASPQDHFGALRYFSEKQTTIVRGGCKEFRDAYHQNLGLCAYFPRNHFGVKASACRLTYAEFCHKKRLLLVSH